MTPADRGARLGAAILDTFIAGLLVYLPFGIGVGVGAGSSSDPTAALLMGLGLGCMGLVIWLALTIKYVLANSQTIGKKLLNIKVVRSDGSPVSFARLFWLRNALNAIPSFIPLYSIVDHLFIFGESRQCLHDRIADTIVIKV